MNKEVPEPPAYSKDISKLKHMSEYADPYCDEVWELWSHNDCACEACKIFYGAKK